MCVWGGVDWLVRTRDFGGVGGLAYLDPDLQAGGGIISTIHVGVVCVSIGAAAAGPLTQRRERARPPWLAGWPAEREGGRELHVAGRGGERADDEGGGADDDTFLRVSERSDGWLADWLRVVCVLCGWVL